MTKRSGLAVLVFFIFCAAGWSAWSWRPDTFEKTKSPVVGQAPRPSPAPSKPEPAKTNSRPATAKERQAATRSILGQLDAFRRDDYKTAISYQSKALHRNFASEKVFRDMIRQSYPQFARYKTVRFGAATVQGKGKEAVVQIPIVLVGEDGVKVDATYFMIEEKGIYRVSGVGGGAQPNPLNDPNRPQAPPAFEGVAPLIT